EVKWPKSVMLVTCLTGYPDASSTLRSTLNTTCPKRLPMCCSSYGVGPQLYMRTVPLMDSKSSTLPERVLWRYTGRVETARGIFCLKLKSENIGHSAPLQPAFALEIYKETDREQSHKEKNDPEVA